MPGSARNDPIDLMMKEEFSNVYDDKTRADAYAKLELPGTYYLAYRDLPAIIGGHVQGRTAMDFGCGTGRSTRLLRELGFDAVGVDIAEHMLARAREADPQGEYRLVPDGDYRVRVSILDDMGEIWDYDTTVKILGFKERTRKPIRIEVSGSGDDGDQGDDQQ